MIRIRAVLFDAAGTLIRLREPVGESYARAARAFGIEIPAAQLDHAFAQALRDAPPLAFPGQSPERVTACEREWWRRLVRSTFLAADAGLRFPDFDACFDRLYREFSAPGAWSTTPGALEVLDELRRRGLATAVVSNFDRRLPALLEGLGLADRLDAVVLPSDVGATKPDPRIFAAALSRLGRRASEALFVGDDHERDVRGALASGLRAIDVASLANLSELPARLRALEQEPA